VAEPTNGAQSASIWTSFVSFPLVISVTELGTVLIAAPTVLAAEGELVPTELVAVTCTETSAPSTNEKGALTKLLMGMRHDFEEITELVVPSQSVASVLQIPVASWIEME
jgi:hypothetical protein